MCYDNNKMLNFLREIYIEINIKESITFISSNCITLLGYSMEELLNKSIQNVLSFILQNSKSVITMKSSVITKKGIVIPVDLTSSPIVDSSNNIIGYRLSLIDISSYIHEKRINQMFERSRDFIYNAELNPIFMLTYLSPSIKNILGYDAQEYYINPMLVFNIVHPDDRYIIKKKLTNEVNFTKPLCARYKHKDGHYVWLEDHCIPIYDINGTLIKLEGFNRDITDKKKLEEKLERLSYYDYLTGAYNRCYLEKEIHILNTQIDLPIGIIFCDLDNLKITNDTMGHEYGDRLIVSYFNILKATFAKSSVIARTGGDEFIVIIKNVSHNKVKALFALLNESICKQNKHNRELQIKVSVGYSFSETSIGVTRQFINIADKNMYKNKLSK
ncbi:sensor domain-containing diguanylate cyclase [Clostridium estertheticum]|uniref:sensor domain-containing diguanylate cyclase n=1 Tax=Clostridium estertheticum TaxID=238834 RepID=UPI001C7CD06A|nr:diguanylate cyclase [Clostridium estertheticum]MBX4267986.1 diguanylate cyclase [Clostridium estertheticum]WLC80071.1 diguanylate cyclase [Clostridium estertheticum]